MFTSLEVFYNGERRHSSLGDLSPADFHAEYRFTLSRKPFGVSTDEPIIQALRGAATGVLGAPPELIGQTFWMDSAFLVTAGIPTVVFGPIGAGAHAVEEWVDLASVDHC